jgi:hypothetical protein
LKVKKKMENEIITGEYEINMKKTDTYNKNIYYIRLTKEILEEMENNSEEMFINVEVNKNNLKTGKFY